MPKKAHGFPVGMMAVRGKLAPSSPAELRAQLKRIYDP